MNEALVGWMIGSLLRVAIWMSPSHAERFREAIEAEIFWESWRA